MKKITILVASLMLATFASKASEIINLSDLNSDFISRFNHNEPIQFSERGIEFFVFSNGEFDFNTRPNQNQGNYYFKTAGKRTSEVNSGQFDNYGVRIEQDNFGRIRRIGNTFINYDIQDRVSRIGSIFLRYNRFSLIQIGGLQLVYNRFGELINTFGSIKNFRNYGFTNNVYSYSGNVYQYQNSGNLNNNYYQYQNENNQYIDNHNDDEYYYKNNGTKEKIEDKKEENHDLKTHDRR